MRRRRLEKGLHGVEESIVKPRRLGKGLPGTEVSRVGSRGGPLLKGWTILRNYRVVFKLNKFSHLTSFLCWAFLLGLRTQQRTQNIYLTLYRIPYNNT